MDLFCGQGGAAAGYESAGFHTVGLDVVAQPRYPGHFQRGDAVAWLRWAAGESPARPWAGCPVPSSFALIHASPPCQDFCQLKSLAGSRGARGPATGWMLMETLRLLPLVEDRWGTAWVVENVPGAAAAMPAPARLCGTQFGLRARCRDGQTRELRRHRLFSASFFWLAPSARCYHQAPPMSVTGRGAPDGRSWPGWTDDARALMRCPWMTRDGLSQAVPPAYTRLIGEQFKLALDCAQEARAAA